MFCQKKPGRYISLIAIFLSVLQLVGGGPLPAAAAPSASLGASGPEGPFSDDQKLEGGEITYVHPSRKENEPRLFLIEDAHASLEAQESIALIIQQLKSRYSKARIFVEGTEGPITWEGFWRFPDKGARAAVARYFLEKGRMSGAEFYTAAETEGEVLYGLEDRTLHQENIKAYLDQGPLKARGSSGLKQFQDGLTKLKGLYFTPALREWEREYRLFDNHSEHLLRYLRFLASWAGKEGLPLGQYPHIQKIVALGKTPSAAELEALKERSRAFAVELFDEKDSLEQALFQRTRGPGEMKKTLEAFRQLDLLEAIFHLELTHREWKEFEKEDLYSRFESVRSALIPFAGRLKIDLSRTDDLLRSLEASRKFYEKAVEREAVMIRTLQDEIRESGTSTAIVIAGGFHSEGIRDHFQEEYGLTQISPAIHDIQRSVPYWEIFEGKRTPLEAWFSGAEILSGKSSRGAYLVAKESAAQDPDLNASVLALLLAASDPAVRTRTTFKDLRQVLGGQFPEPITNLWSNAEDVVVTRSSGESAVLRVQKNAEDSLTVQLRSLAGRVTAPPAISTDGLMLSARPANLDSSFGQSLGNFNEIIVMTPDPKTAPFIYDPGEILDVPTYYLGSLHEVEFALEESAKLPKSRDRSLVAVDSAWAEQLPLDDVIRDWKARFPKAFFAVMVHKDKPLSPAAQKAREAADGILTTHVVPTDLAVELIGLQQAAFGASLGFDSVIIAEDDPEIRSLYEDLVDMGNLPIRGSFGNGVDALEFIRQFKARNQGERFLLITDLNMPGMQGDELSEKIREEFPDIFIVLNTAISDTKKLEELKDPKGHPIIDVVLKKPIELAAFDLKGWAKMADRKTQGASLGFDGVFIVEDSASSRQTYERIFANQKKLPVIGAYENGRQALEAYRKWKAQNPNKTPLIFSDLEMPIMDGLELAKALRAETPGLFIVLNSATVNSTRITQIQELKREKIIDVFTPKVSFSEEVDLETWGTLAEKKARGASLGERPLDKLDKDYPYEVLRRLGEAMIKSHTIKDLAATVTETLKATMDFDRVDMFIVDPLRSTIHSPLTEGAALEADALRLREPYFISKDARPEGPLPGYRPGALEQLDVTDLYLVPLAGKDDSPIAFLSFITEREKTISEKDRLFLKNVAYSIAGRVLGIQAEENLARSEEQFRTLFEDSPTGLHVLSPSGFIMRVNEREAEMLGYRPEEMVGQKFTNFIAPEERANAWTRFEARVAGLEPPAREGDRHYVRKDGRRIIVATKDRVQRDENGKTVQVQTSLIDITERREKESLLEGLNRLMNEMNKRGNVDDVYRVIVEEGTRLLGFDRAGLNLWIQEYDPASGKKETTAKVDYQYHVNPDTIPPEDPRGNLIRQTDTGLTAETIREKRPIIADYRKEPGRLTERGKQAGIIYSISLPIRSQDRIIGNIIFSTADPDFTLKEGSLSILERLVTYLSVAIETKKAAEGLRSAREFLAKTVEHIPAMLFIKQAEDLNFVYHNRKFEEFMGLGPGATVGTTDYDYFPKEQADFFRAKDLEVLKGGKEVDIPEEHISTPRGIRILHTTKVPILGPDGKPQYLLGISEDITERKIAEQALAESRLRLQTILDAAPFAILMRGADLKLEYTNERGEKLFKAMIGQSKKSGFIPAIFEGSASLKDHYLFENETALKKGVSINREDEISVDGKQRFYHVIKEPLKSPDGTVFGLLEIYEDITEAREALDRAKNAEKWESTTLMAGQIAHDFNNLLVSPLAEPDLIRSRLQVGEPVEENLTRIQNSASTMQEIARELLTLSKIGKAHFEPMDLTQVVKQISGMYQSNFPGVRFDAAGLDTPHYIKGHVGQLGQVVSNLVVNAGDAMAERGGDLTLKMEEISLEDPSQIHQSVKDFKPGRYVKLTVKDTGSGIPADLLPRIFDPFFSTKQADARRGSGLGLSTVKGVLESHGGFVDVKTVLGEGTEFYAYVPVSMERPKSAVVKAPESTKGKGLIWVIDDELPVRELATDVLKDAGYQVVDFDSGTAAVKAAESGEVVIPDLVLSDMRMEGNERAGLEAYVGIKKALKVEALKGIMMSGNVSGDTVADSKKAGFSKFLGKPFRLSELVDIVSAELAAQASPAAAVTKDGVETLLIVEDDELIGDMLEKFSKMWKKTLGVTWVKSAREARQQLDANAPFDVIYLDQNLPDGTGTQVYQGLVSSNKKSAFTRIIFASGSGVEEAPFKADASLSKPFNPKEFVETLKRFDSEIRGDGTGVSMTPVRPADVDRLSGQSLGEKIDADPLLRDYFQTAKESRDLDPFFSLAAEHKGPLALVFAWEALQNGAMAEELALLFRLMPELKIYVASEKPFDSVNEEFAAFDPRGLLTPYREWGNKPQLLLLPGHSIQEAKKASENFVGKGPQGESVTGVFVVEGDKDTIRFLGTPALYRFVAVQKTRSEKEGRLLALPTIGIWAMLGAKDLPENIQKDADGTFRVFAFDLAEISAQLTKELLGRTALAQAA